MGGCKQLDIVLKYQWPEFDSWMGNGDGLLQFFLVETCAFSSVPVLPLCAQQTPGLLRVLKIPFPPCDKARGLNESCRHGNTGNA